MKKILAVAAASAFALTACGGSNDYRDDDNYVGVCTDGQGNRVDDSYCQHAPAYSNGGGMDGSSFVWGYLLANSMMPRYGQHVDHVVYHVDDTKHNVYRGGVPKQGGKLDLNKYKPMASKIAKKAADLGSKKYKDYVANKSKPGVQDSKQFGQKGNSSYNKSGQSYKPSTKSGGWGSSSKSGSSSSFGGSKRR